MFKVGDKVICIRNNEARRLILNKVYIVRNIDGNCVKVDEFDGFYWLSERFKKVENYSKHDIMNFINKLESKL